MALLYKQLSPLYGVWKMEESSDELLGMASIKRTILLFGAGIGLGGEAEARNVSPAGCFKRAFRRGQG